MVRCCPSWSEVFAVMLVTEQAPFHAAGFGCLSLKDYHVSVAGIHVRCIGVAQSSDFFVGSERFRALNHGKPGFKGFFRPNPAGAMIAGDLLHVVLFDAENDIIHFGIPILKW